MRGGADLAVEHRSSIFSQKLDRVAFTAYFLGAVVPLLALGVVVDRFVLPAVADRGLTLALIGVVTSIGVLSLASFLTLRRGALRSLARMDQDNRHLQALLEAAGQLASAEHGSDAARSAAEGGLVLTQARACYVVLRGEPGQPPIQAGVAGEDAEKFALDIAAPLGALVNVVLSEDRPALQGASEETPALAAVPLSGEVVPSGALVVAAQPGVTSFSDEELGPLATLGSLAAVATRNGDLQDAQRNFFTHVTDMLVSALDSSLGYHAGHGTRVAELANRIGRTMGLEDHRMQRLHFAAMLHDVGLLKLDRELRINRRTAMTHALLGGRMLARIRLWQDLAPIVQHHHEWWDGSGYPDGLSADAIPLEARIIAVCDVFDTITSDSSYKQAMPFEQAVHEIEACAGRQFDPAVVSALQTLVRDGEIGPEL